MAIKNVGSRKQTAYDRIPVVTKQTDGLILGELFNLSVQQFPHPQNGENKVTYFAGLLWQLDQFDSCKSHRTEV